MGELNLFIYRKKGAGKGKVNVKEKCLFKFLTLVRKGFLSMMKSKLPE